MQRITFALFLVLLLAAPAWAGQCALPPGGQCSLVLDPAPAPVEVVNLDQGQGGSVLGFWLYAAQIAPHPVTAGLNPGEAVVFSPPQVKDGQGSSFAARTLVLYNMGTCPLSVRTLK